MCENTCTATWWRPSLLWGIHRVRGVAAPMSLWLWGMHASEMVSAPSEPLIIYLCLSPLAGCMQLSTWKLQAWMMRFHHLGSFRGSAPEELCDCYRWFWCDVPHILGFCLISGADAVGSSEKAQVHLRLTRACLWPPCPCAFLLSELLHPNISSRARRRKMLMLQGKPVTSGAGGTLGKRFSLSAFRWATLGGMCSLCGRFPWVQTLGNPQQQLQRRVLTLTSPFSLSHCSYNLNPVSWGHLPNNPSISKSSALISGGYKLR